MKSSFKETAIKVAIIVVKAAAVVGASALAVQIVRKNWNPSAGTIANLRSTFPALIALAYATNKGVK